MDKDPYLKKFVLHVSGLRNWLWGIVTLGLKYTQISHRIEVVDSMDRTHELYRKYRKIFYMPWKKLYIFRFSVTVPANFAPKQIILKRMQPGNCVWRIVGGVQFDSQQHVCGKQTIFDTFTWDEINNNSDD